VLVMAGTLLLGLLFYWLLGFVVKDIGTLRGPDRRAVEQELIEAELLANERQLAIEIEDGQRSITDLKKQQAVLRDSADNSEKTMNRLLELQKLNLQKEVAPSEVEQRALGESQQLFLANQRQYQTINQEVAALTDRLRELEGRQRENNRQLQAARVPAAREYEDRARRHQWKLAAFKLAVLVPLLGAVVFLALRWRGSLYAPLLFALGLATLAKVLLVMHEHFPRVYFKYILIVASLALVVRVLVYLLRMVAYPRPDWLLKQYREAYERFLCPICAYPIRRGPLRYLFWTRRTVKRLRHLPEGQPAEPEAPYVCPMCGTALFEPCPECQAVRHALLPSCSRCGAQKPAVQLVGVNGANGTGGDA